MEGSAANPLKLEARGVRIDRAEQTVLQAIDFTLHAGEIVGLVGPPDAGKTTLLKGLAGLIPLSHGSMRVRGKPYDLCCDAWRKQVGFAFQNDALFDDLSVFDNVAFALRRRRWEPARIKSRVDARLDDVDLSAVAKSLPSTLSGGMRKRVGIARATAIDALVGLFDDPIAGLDPQTGRRIMGMLSRLTRHCGLATCIVANDLPQLLPHCDRVVMLHAGQVVFDGLPQDAAHSAAPAVRQFFTGSLDGPL